MKTLLHAATGLALLFTLAAPGRAEITACTPITTVPVTITTQGIYCFTGDIAASLASGNAITVATNNVTIDLNGHKFGNLGAGVGTQAHGFYASQRQNITIRNGTVRGFFYGVWLNDTSPFTASGGHLIEDLRLDGNTLIGIDVEGSGNVVRRNQVARTGGSIASNNAYGIIGYGPGAQILDNVVDGTTGKSGGNVYSINLYTANGAMVARNHVSNVSGGANNYGIFVVSSTDVIVADNRLATMQYGVYYYPGSTGKYFNNVTQGIGTPYTGGTAGTINN